MEQKKKQKERKAANPTDFKKPFHPSNDNFKKPREVSQTKKVDKKPVDYKKPVSFVKPGQEASQPQDSTEPQSQETDKSQEAETNQSQETTQNEAMPETIHVKEEEVGMETTLKRKASETGFKEDVKKHKANDVEEVPATTKPKIAFNPRPRATRGIRGGRGKAVALPARALAKSDSKDIPEPTVVTDTTSKSNDDFRNMLLGKK